MGKSATFLLDQDVFDSLRNTLDIAIIRSSDNAFISMNATALFLFGFEHFDDARHFPRRMIFADAEIFHHISNKLDSCGCLYNERILFKKYDQTNFWGKLTSLQRKVDGKIVFDEKIVDITYEVEQEHRLAEKSHQLEKVRGELDRFIYSASHDLRSPITTALGLVHLMKISPTSHHNEYFEMLEQSLHKLEANVQKLVDFSKNVNERVLSEELDLKQLLHVALDQLGSHVHFKKASVDVQVVGDCTIYSDGAKISSVLFQLLKNCLDYIDLRKSASFINIRFSQLPEKCRIDILDNGQGIFREHLPHVFQMFYRATDLSKGSGLGLFVAKEAITRLNGSIEIESEPGIGTSISVTIPNSRK